MVSIFHGSLALLTWDNQIQTDMSSRVYPYITPGPSGGAVPPKWKIPCAAAKASILPPWASLGLHIKRLWVNALFCLVWLLIITPKVVCDWQRFKQAKVTKFSYPKTLGGYKTLARPGAVGCRHPDRVRLAPCTDCRTPVALAGGAPIAECHPGPDRTAVRYLLASLSKNRLIVEDSYTRGWPRPITHSRGFWTRPNTVLFVRYLLTLQIAPPPFPSRLCIQGGRTGLWVYTTHSSEIIIARRPPSGRLSPPIKRELGGFRVDWKHVWYYYWPALVVGGL